MTLSSTFYFITCLFKPLSFSHTKTCRSSSFLATVYFILGVNLSLFWLIINEELGGFYLFLITKSAAVMPLSRSLCTHTRVFLELCYSTYLGQCLTTSFLVLIHSKMSTEIENGYIEVLTAFLHSNFMSVDSNFKKKLEFVLSFLNIFPSNSFLL